MRFILVAALTCRLILAQTGAPPASLASAPPVITVDVPPLSPPDLDSPYASPRDAARHRFQATLAELRATRNIRAALAGFAEVLLGDPTYAPAAFDLGVVAAIAEKWEDALAAFEAAGRLDPNGLGREAAPQIKRLRLVNSLEATGEGKRQRQYDEALHPLLGKLPKVPAADAMTALAEVGRIDPKRWEAPALLAGLNGNGRGYDVAAKFLEIAVANAADPAVKARLEKALHAAERELRYAAARLSAEAAADRGEYEKAGELYETAWTAIPARSSNGMEAASCWLLHDDTARASALLIRLRASGNGEFVTPAAAMLKELEVIEPGAKATGGDAAEFFREAGSALPVHIADLIPPVNDAAMEVLAQPLPRLIQDPQPVVLLATLSANPVEAGQSAALPTLAPPKLPGEHPWRELLQLRSPGAAAHPGATDGAAATADISHGTRTRHLLHVTSEPAGARIFVGDEPDSACETPCDLQAALGSYTVRVTLPGYKEDTKRARITGARTDLAFALEPVRGNIILQTSIPAPLKVNGTTVANQNPVEISLIPGLYRISADFGSTTEERLINVRPGARLRLELHP